MGHSHLTSLLQGHRRLPEDIQGHGRFDRAMATEKLAEIAPGYILLRDKVQTACRANFVDLNNTRLSQSRSRLSFPDETLDIRGVLAQFGLEHLEGDFAPQRNLLGQIDIGHPTGSEPAEERVVTQGLPYQILRRWIPRPRIPRPRTLRRWLCWKVLIHEVPVNEQIRKAVAADRSATPADDRYPYILECRWREDEQEPGQLKPCRRWGEGTR